MANRREDFVDLHTHTIFSDGLFTPEEVIIRASQLGFAAVAITDHDSVDGIERALQAARSRRVEVVPGAEFSCNVNGTDVHIVGYYFDYRRSEVQEFFARVRQRRLERAEKMVQKLAELGVVVSFSRVRELAGAGAVGRPHLAQAMVEAGVVANLSEAFERYIGYHAPAYIPKMRLTPAQVVNFIHENGGLSVVAHPATYGNDDLLYPVIAAGVDGIEVWHPEHNDRAVAHYLEVATKNRLLVTGGSDCHGGRKFGKIYLGDVRLPYKYLAALKARLKRS